MSGGLSRPLLFPTGPVSTQGALNPSFDGSSSSTPVPRLFPLIFPLTSFQATTGLLSWRLKQFTVAQTPAARSDFATRIASQRVADIAIQPSSELQQGPSQLPQSQCGEVLSTYPTPTLPHSPPDLRSATHSPEFPTTHEDFPLLRLDPSSTLHLKPSPAPAPVHLCYHLLSVVVPEPSSTSASVACAVQASAKPCHPAAPTPILTNFAMPINLSIPAPNSFTTPPTHTLSHAIKPV